MPIYEYTCRNCGEDFDLLRRLKDNDDDVECPYCREKDAERRMSATASDAKPGVRVSHNFGGGGCTRFG